MSGNLRGIVGTEEMKLNPADMMAKNATKYSSDSFRTENVDGVPLTYEGL